MRSKALWFSRLSAASNICFSDSGVQKDLVTAQAACAVTKSFWTPLSEKQMLLAADSLEDHQLDRMVMRTFYIPGLNNAKDTTDIVDLLRGLFEIRFVSPQAQSGTIVVRARSGHECRDRFLSGLDNTKPQVKLDIRVYRSGPYFYAQYGIESAQPVPDVQYSCGRIGCAEGTEYSGLD